MSSKSEEQGCLTKLMWDGFPESRGHLQEGPLASAHPSHTYYTRVGTLTKLPLEDLKGQHAYMTAEAPFPPPSIYVHPLLTSAKTLLEKPRLRA